MVTKHYRVCSVLAHTGEQKCIPHISCNTFKGLARGRFVYVWGRTPRDLQEFVGDTEAASDFGGLERHFGRARLDLMVHVQ